MAYPLIILGAGASYDFLKIERHDPNDQYTLSQWRPPLTKNIFDVSRFSRIIGKYRDVQPLASTVINKVENDPYFDFEKYLSEEEAQFSEKSYPQIMALRFYLAELFSKISYNFYRHTNNHSYLIDQINKRIGKAIVVNFNYDTLFEKNIANIEQRSNINSYVEGNIKVIKIHGAYNWKYTPKIDLNKHDVYDFFTNGGIALYNEYKNHDVNPMIMKDVDYSHSDFDMNSYRSWERGDFPSGRWLYYLPAIAIPINSKDDHICPKSHIEVLVNELQQVDRILMIGWRAQDKYLLSLLQENLPSGVKLTIVSKGSTQPREIIEKFKGINQIELTDMSFPSEGYSNFMIKGGVEEFLIA